MIAPMPAAEAFNVVSAIQSSVYFKEYCTTKSSAENFFVKIKNSDKGAAQYAVQYIHT